MEDINTRTLFENRCLGYPGMKGSISKIYSSFSSPKGKFSYQIACKVDLEGSDRGGRLGPMVSLGAQGDLEYQAC